MTVLTTLAGPLIGAASPLSSAVVETWVKPKLAKLAKSQKLNRLLFEHSLDNKFTDYLKQAYQRHSYIRTLVFQYKPMLLDSLYLPLTVRISAEGAGIRVDSYRKELVPALRKVLLTDSAGMGKSTLLRYLFLACINENAGTPFFIELRQLTSTKTILDVVQEQLRSIDDEIDKDLILELLRQGDFIFFLDGYDEIPFAIRDEVTTQIQEFISKAGNNDFILSSRPEEALATFADFNRANIEPLTKLEAYQLLDKYDQGAGLSTKIIEKLEQPGFSNVQEFLSNPLLVSLLYKAYQYENHIPLKKFIFYRQVYDALYHSHDLTKPGAYVRAKNCNLDIEEFHSVMRSLGFITLKTGRVEYAQDELLSFITDAKKGHEQSVFREADFLNDLITTVPLFVREGDYFRWNHKSIQEYFAAQYICRDAKGLQAQILRTMASNPAFSRFRNVLDMCYDMDYITFRNTVVYDVAKNVVKYWENTYTKIDRSLIPETEIDSRKALSFEVPIAFFHPDVLSSVDDESKVHTVNENDERQKIHRIFESISQFVMKTNLLGIDNAGAFSMMLSTDGVAVCFFRIFLVDVTNFLSTKQSSLFKAPSEYEPLVFDAGIAKDLFLLDVLPEGAGLLLSDDPLSPLNNPVNFSKVNRAIGRGNAIDLESCKALVDLVERETSREAQEGILAGLV